MSLKFLVAKKPWMNLNFSVDKGEVLGFLGTKWSWQIYHHENDHRLFSNQRKGIFQRLWL